MWHENQLKEIELRVRTARTLQDYLVCWDMLEETFRHRVDQPATQQSLGDALHAAIHTLKERAYMRDQWIKNFRPMVQRAFAENSYTIKESDDFAVVRCPYTILAQIPEYVQPLGIAAAPQRGIKPTHAEFFVGTRQDKATKAWLFLLQVGEHRVDGGVTFSLSNVWRSGPYHEYMVDSIERMLHSMAYELYPAELAQKKEAKDG